MKEIMQVLAYLNSIYFFPWQGPILPGQHSIERYLIEEQLRHIFQANHEERKEW